MSRPHRIEYPGAWYLIENQGVKGLSIFNDEEDYLTFFDLLAEISQIFSIEVHAYSLLENQYFLLVRTPLANLSRAMRHLNGIYTQKYNQAWENSGPIFWGRYKSRIIDHTKYLHDVISFIHSRPVETSLVNKASDHAWTSHQPYLKSKERPDWLYVAPIIKTLGFLKAFALAKLIKSVASGPSKKFTKLYDKERVVLGDDKFKKEVQNLRKQARKKTRSKNVKPNKNATTTEILNFVASSYNIKVTEIKQSQPGIQNEARSMAVYQLRTVAGLSQNMIAKTLNSSSGYTVAKTLQRFNNKIAEDNELADITTKMTESLYSRVSQ